MTDEQKSHAVAARYLAASQDKSAPKKVDDLMKDVKKKNPSYSDSQAWATAWSVYCVAGDTLIPTNQGIKNILSLYQEAAMVVGGEPHPSPISIRVSTKDGIQDASFVVFNGLRHTVRVTTSLGYQVEVTPDHQVLTLNPHTYALDWKTADTLLPDEYLVIQTEGVWGSSTGIPDFSYTIKAHNNVMPLVTPKTMTLSLARILGYLVAEGSITHEGVEFCNSNPRVIEDYQRCVREVFKYEAHKIEATPGHWKIRLRARWFQEFFQFLGMAPGLADSKSVPWCIMSSPKIFVFEFLRAYAEGDGFLGDNHANRLSFGTASETLAIQLQMILTNCGIPASRHFDPTASGNPFWVVQVSNREGVCRYASDVGTLFKSVSFSESDNGTPTCALLPIQGIQYIADTKPNHNVGRFGWCRQTKKVSLFKLKKVWSELEKARAWAPEIVGNLHNLLHSSLRFDQVKHVVDAGEQEVYDLTVPSSESFSANGLVVHNCKHVNPDSDSCHQDSYLDKK